MPPSCSLEGDDLKMRGLVGDDQRFWRLQQARLPDLWIWGLKLMFVVNLCAQVRV
jgi:hypothetical protein